MCEMNELNRQDDLYEDRQTETDELHRLYELLATYETGFMILREQLVELKNNLQVLAGKVDTIDRRTLPGE